MKIGSFSVDNKVSIDTIRYYMELGLIIPEKIGGQYDFDKKCKQDLEDILNLKEMEFTLNEIKSIFLFKRLGKLTSYQETEIYREFYINKHQRIAKKILGLQEAKLRLEKKLEAIKTSRQKSTLNMGVDISALRLFRCPHCRSAFALKKGHIANNQVVEGTLECSCGNQYIIVDGILIGDILNNDSNALHSVNLDNIAEYINETDSEYLNHLYKSLEWAHKKLNYQEISDKTILDLGSGSGFLTRHIYNSLPDNSLFIAVDRDIERHRYLKDMLEKTGVYKKIVFICCDFLKLPIAYKSIDVILDYGGTSNYSFENKEFLLKQIDKFANDKAVLLGSYILFEKFGANSFIDPKVRKNFIQKHIEEQIRKLNYNVFDKKISKTVNKGGRFEDYFSEGQGIYYLGFYGKKEGYSNESG